MVIVYSIDQLAWEVILLHPCLNPLCLLIVHALVHVELGEVVSRLGEEESQVYARAKHGQKSEKLLRQRVWDNITVHDGSHRTRA